jgi:hypothetical protein
MMEQTWSILSDVLTTINYKRDPVPPGYKRFELVEQLDKNFAQLNIFTWNEDTFNKGYMRYTRHEFIVPVATYNKDTWVRWVFECIDSIERHETCENFLVNGKRIYSPHHGNGENPYYMWYASYPEKKKIAPGHENDE